MQLTLVYHQILVPVDGSEASQLGLREAISIARAFDARIRLVHVVNELAPLTGRPSVPDIRRALLFQSRRPLWNAMNKEAALPFLMAAIEPRKRVFTSIGFVEFGTMCISLKRIRRADE